MRCTSPWQHVCSTAFRWLRMRASNIAASWRKLTSALTRCLYKHTEPQRATSSISRIPREPLLTLVKSRRSRCTPKVSRSWNSLRSTSRLHHPSFWQKVVTIPGMATAVRQWQLTGIPVPCEISDFTPSAHAQSDMACHTLVAVHWDIKYVENWWLLAFKFRF